MADYDSNKALKDQEKDKFIEDSNNDLAVNVVNPNIKDLVDGNSNIPIVEGSKSEEKIFQTILAYDSNNNPEYVGESAQNALTSTESWYIERFTYDASYNVTNIKVATNKLYSGSGTVDVDKDINSPKITVTVYTADYSLLQVGDYFDLTTVANGNKIKGTIDSINSNVFVINVIDITGIVNETGAAIGATDLIYTLEASLINKKVWDFRARYIYA